MLVTPSSKPALDPMLEALRLMRDPVEFKARIETLQSATKKFNKARKKHDDAVAIAETIEDAEVYATKHRRAINELEMKRDKMDKDRKQRLTAQEMSMGRREGAHQIVVKEHEEAAVATRKELSNLASSLAKQEAILDRGKRQLAQDNASLKTAQEAFSERRARLAQALKN